MYMVTLHTLNNACFYRMREEQHLAAYEVIPTRIIGDVSDTGSNASYSADPSKRAQGMKMNACRSQTDRKLNIALQDTSTDSLGLRVYSRSSR